MELSQIPSRDEIQRILIEKGQWALGYWRDRPLWVKLSVATTAVSYGYMRYKWTALNGCGHDILPPSFPFGTAGHYAADGAFPEFTQKELMDKNRKTVAYYRLLDPIILTIDTELIKQVFTTHFGSFPHRMPFEASLGFGKEFRTTLDQVSDVHQWKRLRSTMSPGFSNRQLGEMLAITNSCLDKLVEQIDGLNGGEVDSKTIGGKFAIDAFLQSALSVDMNKDLGTITDFEKHPFVKHFLYLLNPPGAVIIPAIIPGLGDLLDMLDIQIAVGPSIRWFRSFCRALLEQHGGEGRTKDFLHIFASNKISDADAPTVTKGFTEAEMIGQIFILLGAGYETTATTLNWTMYQICKDQNLQEKLREEATRTDTANLANITPETMPWTCATINEILRLRSPVGLHLRHCVNSVNLGGKWIEKGFNIEIPVDALHYCTEYWGDDAAEFSPKRFIDNPGLEKEWFYMPFGGGPRNCIGMRFALLQSRVALARLLQQFEISFPDGFVDDVKPVRLINTFLFPSKKVMVKFTKVN